MFRAGHGVAKVVGVQTHSLGEGSQEFLVLELLRGGKVFVPQDNVDSAELRLLISSERADELLTVACTAPELDSTGLKERVGVYTQQLRTGDANLYTHVLQQLLYRGATGKLATSEQRLLETARAYFVDEMSTVLERPAEALDATLDAAFGD